MRQSVVVGTLSTNDLTRSLMKMMTTFHPGEELINTDDEQDESVLLLLFSLFLSQYERNEAIPQDSVCRRLLHSSLRRFHRWRREDGPQVFPVVCSSFSVLLECLRVRFSQVHQEKNSGFAVETTRCARRTWSLF